MFHILLFFGVVSPDLLRTWHTLFIGYTPHLIDLADLIKSEWESITEFHSPPCVMFLGLVFLFSILIILPS